MSFAVAKSCVAERSRSSWKETQLRFIGSIRRVLMRARHRLSKLLLRQGIVYYGGNAWTGKHDTWLRTEALPQLTARATRLASDSDYETVLVIKARRDRLDAAIEEMAADSEFTPLVRRLGCLRGVSTLTAFALAVEIVRIWLETSFAGERHSRRSESGGEPLAARESLHDDGQAFPEIDGRDLLLEEAIQATEEGEWGTILGCIPGRLAYYRGEYGNERLLLERTV